VTSSRERNDRNRPGGRPFRKPFSGAKPDAGEWVWGRHAVEAALANPAREIRRLVAEGRPTREIRQKAADEGLLELRRFALLRVAQGETSAEEVLRAIPAEYLGIED